MSLIHSHLYLTERLQDDKVLDLELFWPLDISHWHLIFFSLRCSLVESNCTNAKIASVAALISVALLYLFAFFPLTQSDQVLEQVRKVRKTKEVAP